MRRREFISALGSVIAAWPRAIMAQSAAKRPLVAVLLAVSSTAGTRYVSSFPQGLRELGYVEGQNIDIVYRYAEGDLTRLPTLADELVQLNPDVIVTAGSAVPAIKRSTAMIPIVGVALTDPESLGFVTSIAHPGGQVTGIIYTVDSLPGKQLQLALELLPDASRIGLLLPRQRPPHLRASLLSSRSACPMTLMPPSRHGSASELIWGSYFRTHCSSVSADE